MKTTITEYKKTTCHKCGGDGRLSHYGHVKGGECFACSGTGIGYGETFEREMTDSEVLNALEISGFPVVFAEFEKTGDWLVDLFQQSKNHAEVMKGARLMLAAI